MSLVNVILSCRGYCRGSVRVAYRLLPLQTAHQYHGEVVGHAKSEEYDNLHTNNIYYFIMNINMMHEEMSLPNYYKSLSKINDTRLFHSETKFRTLSFNQSRYAKTFILHRLHWG